MTRRSRSILIALLLVECLQCSALSLLSLWLYRCHAINLWHVQSLKQSIIVTTQSCGHEGREAAKGICDAWWELRDIRQGCWGR